MANFLQVTKFLSDEIFPRPDFSWPAFFPDFFSIIIIIIIIIIISLFICKIYYYHAFLMYFIYRCWAKQF